MYNKILSLDFNLNESSYSYCHDIVLEGLLNKTIGTRQAPFFNKLTSKQLKTKN